MEPTPAPVPDLAELLEVTASPVPELSELLRATEPAPPEPSVPGTALDLAPVPRIVVPHVEGGPPVPPPSRRPRAPGAEVDESIPTPPPDPRKPPAKVAKSAKVSKAARPARAARPGSADPTVTAATIAARLGKPPRPTQDRTRIFALVGVLAVVVVGAVVIFAVSGNDDSGTKVEGLSQTRSTTTVAHSPLPSANRAAPPTLPSTNPDQTTDPSGSTGSTVDTSPPTGQPTTQKLCNKEFVRQMGGPAFDAAVVDTFQTCTAKQWVKAYDITALQLGNSNPDGLGLLENECVKRRSSGVEPPACIGVPTPPTSG